MKKFNSTPLIYWFEQYQKGLLKEEEKKALFDYLNTDMLAKDEWDEWHSLEQTWTAQKKRTHFLHEIELAKQQNKSTNIKKPLFVLTQWKYAAAVLIIIGFTALSTWALLSNNKQQQSNEYLQLRREVEYIKNSQNALIKNFKEDQSINQENVWASKYSGTGFSIHKDGYLVTNYHVVEDAQEIMVEDPEGVHYPAFVIAFDNKADIAILKIQDTTYQSTFDILPYILSDQSASLAEPIFSLGFPINSLVYHEGYISGQEGFNEEVDAYLLELTSDPGQSGAPVFNKNGAIIGMITGKQNNTQGKTYAIHMSYVIDLMESLPEENKIPLKQSLSLKNYKRTDQVAQLRDYIFAIKVK